MGNVRFRPGADADRLEFGSPPYRGDMETLRSVSSMVIAVLVGIALRLVQTYVWVLEAEHFGLLHWISTHGWSTGSLGYLVFLEGFCVDVALSLPAAWIIMALRPKRRLLYLLLGVVPCFVYFDAYQHWLLNLEWDPFLALGYIKVLLTLPLAVWILLRVSQSRGLIEVSRD